MPVQEFRPIVAIEPLDRKRQGFLDGLDLRHHTIGTLVPGCPAFRPAGADIGHGQTPHEIPRQAVTAMRHRVGLDKAGLGHIPLNVGSQVKRRTLRGWLPSGTSALGKFCIDAPTLKKHVRKTSVIAAPDASSHGHAEPKGDIHLFKMTKLSKRTSSFSSGGLHFGRVGTPPARAYSSYIQLWTAVPHPSHQEETQMP